VFGEVWVHLEPVSLVSEFQSFQSLQSFGEEWGGLTRFSAFFIMFKIPKAFKVQRVSGILNIMKKALNLVKPPHSSPKLCKL
jgi:ABC-type polysaccharide transport system permease subunit